MSKPEVPAEQKRSRKPSTELQTMASLERVMDDSDVILEAAEMERIVQWFIGRYQSRTVEPTCTDPADG